MRCGTYRYICCSCDPRELNETPSALRTTESFNSNAPFIRSASCPGVNKSISSHLRARRCTGGYKHDHPDVRTHEEVQGWYGAGGFPLEKDDAREGTIMERYQTVEH